LWIEKKFMETEHSLAEYRADVEKRLKEQIDRHRSINPTATTKQIKAIQLSQEIERIEKTATTRKLRLHAYCWQETRSTGCNGVTLQTETLPDPD